MLDGYSTNAMVAKIRSIYGKMLTREDLRELVAKRSVAEVADHLSQTARFAEAMRDIDPNTIHRGMLERVLAEYNFNTYMRLTSFQGLENKPFYDFLINRCDVRELISLVNAVNNGLQESFVNAVPGYILKNSKLRFMMLAKCRTIDELTEALKGTKYYKVFKGFKRTEDGKAFFTDAEVKLRTFFYEELMLAISDSFFGKEEDELTDLVKTEIDNRNIINSYRLKAYFRYTPDEIRKTLLPFSKQGRHMMNKLYDAEDPAGMLVQLRKMPGGRFITEDMDSVESSLGQRMLATMRHVIAKTNSAPTALYAFEYICDTELKNIIRIIEGVRYDADPAYINKLLIT